MHLVVKVVKAVKSELSSLRKMKKLYPEITAENLVSVSIMPCTAKKYEAKREQLYTNGRPDTDIVLTTKELGAMIKGAGIDFKNINYN